MLSNDLVLIWGESVTDGPGGTPTISVSAWSDAIGRPWLRWNTADTNSIPQEVRNARIAVVNLFQTHDSRHIEQIKAFNPSCYVIACPDPSLDMVLCHPEWENMWYQMSLADAIGGRTNADCALYGTLFDKPTFWLPSTIGPTEYFLPFHDVEKEDYVLTLDHAFAPVNTANNVAVLAALQRETGCRVLYAAERDWTRQYAQYAGLKAEFLGRVPFEKMVELTAKARLCVDMYTSHAVGRQAILCAMVKTLCITSNWCQEVPLPRVDPFNLAGAIGSGRYLYQEYKDMVDVQRERYIEVLHRFSFEACQKRFEAIERQVVRV